MAIALTAVRNPLMSSKVERKDTQAYLTRGVWLRKATRKMIVTSQRMGGSKTSAEIASPAHHGMGERSLACCNGVGDVTAVGSTAIWVISSALTTTFPSGIESTTYRAIRKRSRW